MTEHTEPRLTAEELYDAAATERLYANISYPQGDKARRRLHEKADRVAAHADLLPRLWAVLDVLSEADLRRAWDFLRFSNGMEAAQLAERLRAAANALHALEAEQPPERSWRDPIDRSKHHPDEMR